MKMIYRSVTALLLILFSVGSANAGDTMTLLYSGNTDGELEPCGCSVEGDLGGILRRATTIDRLREERPGLFLVSAGGLLVSASPLDRQTGEHILKGVAQLGYDAVGLQWADLAYGEAFINNDALPWVATNRASAIMQSSRLIERDGKRLAVFSWLAPELSPMAAMKGEHNGGEVQASVQPLTEALSAAQAGGSLTMLTTSLTLADAQDKLPLHLVDILVIKAAYEIYGEPQQIDNTLIIQPGSRGMRLGRLDLSLSKDGRIASWQHEVIAMPDEVPDAERLLGWYDNYNAAVKKAYKERVKLRKAARAGKSPFAGEHACKACHSEAHDIWSGTLHSKAFSKLEEVNKGFDPNCIGCHTVGFEQEGGYIDFDATPDLMNVQCESCHGAGRAHVDAGGAKPLAHSGWAPKQMCVQCHEKKHSPTFDIETYWPRIRHGAK